MLASYHDLVHIEIPSKLGLKSGDRDPDVKLLHKYLEKFGYIKPDQRRGLGARYDVKRAADKPNVEDVFDDNTQKALFLYQEFFKLPQTGILDKPTLYLMSRPRCGFPDIIESDFLKFNAVKRWDRNDLSFRINNFTPDMTMIDILASIRNAFVTWSLAIPVNFNAPTGNEADINISWEIMDHNDGFPFDGPYGTLAHAFSPEDGRLHFDEDELWSISPLMGFHLEAVALHELGHVLGLGHSTDIDAVMFPTYNNTTNLGVDDIAGIQQLYGGRINNHIQIDSAQLTDGRPQLFAIDGLHFSKLWSSWKVDTDADAKWIGWNTTNFAGHCTQISSAQLTDKRPQLFALDITNSVWSSWKADTDADAAWNSWTQFQPGDPPTSKAFVQIASAQLTDGRPQLFGIDFNTNGLLWSTWKADTDADAAWNSWTQFQPGGGPASGVFLQIASAQLTDGRPQLFGIARETPSSFPEIWSTWKSDTDADAAWNSWTQFQPGGGPASGVFLQIASAQLTDGRPQLFGLDASNQVWSTWKSDTDADAAWNSWTQFQPGGGPASGVFLQIASAQLTDGRPQLFGIDFNTNGLLWSTWKADTDADAAWNSWTRFL